MNDILFRIDELHCAYKRGSVVLKVAGLEIPRRKLIVILGKSGGGKSTLLETLGLMNNTIDRGDILFFPSREKEGISYSGLWKETRNEERSRIRRGYFSFIFQNTNLMPNFTALENACLTQMIQGISLKKANEKVRQVMSDLGLRDVPEWKNASELSGGQKQRLAFVRAITPDFTVLFGDEPTGNLDESNSDELISILKDNIVRNNRSAIIVSHNIHLSLKYADTLVLLKKTGKEGDPVELSQSCVYQRLPEEQKWKNWKNELVSDIHKEIQSIF
jgi:ABC-type lipoprotein export system ATPase subunit